MNEYFEITILPEHEINGNTLLGLVFVKLHQAIGKYGRNREGIDIGISFPSFEVDNKQSRLGNLIRLHGSNKSLLELEENLKPLLVILMDSIRISDIRAIPDNVSYRVIHRVQTKGNPERYQRRRMSRHTPEEIDNLRKLPPYNTKVLRLPYVNVTSQSNDGMHFKLFISHGILSNKPLDGRFTTYGLSHPEHPATVPWF